MSFLETVRFIAEYLIWRGAQVFERTRKFRIYVPIVVILLAIVTWLFI